MDSTILVTDLVGAGEDLIGKLREQQFAQQDVFWTFDEEDDRWDLYLVKPDIERQGSRRFVQAALDAAMSLDSWLDRSLIEIQVRGIRDPLAKAIGSYMVRFAPRPNSPLTRGSGLFSEGVLVNEAWIYPR